MPTLEDLASHVGAESTGQQEERITVIDPSGRRGTIPARQLRLALARGFRPASPRPTPPFSGFASRLGIPFLGSLAGGLAGAVAGEAVMPAGGGIPGAMIGRTLGAGLAEAGRERLSQGRINPVEAIGTGVGFGIAPGLESGVQKGIGLLPLVRSFARPGTFGSAAIKSGLTGGTIASSQAAAEAAPMSQPALGQRASAAARVFPEAALLSGAAGGVFHSIYSLWKARTGMPRLQAQQAVDQMADRIGLEYRPGGSLHEDSMVGMNDMGNWAWQPMKDVAKRIPTTSALEDVQATLSQLPEMSNDPIRLQNAQQALKSVWPTETISRRSLGASSRIRETKVPRAQVSASELVEASSRSGAQLPRGVVRGTAALGGGDLPLSDARVAIAHHLEALAPPELKGEATLARARYKDFVQGIRDPFFEFLQPRSSPEGSTNKAVDTITQIAAGKASPSDMRAFSRIALLADESHGRLTPEEVWDLTTARSEAPSTSPLVPQAQARLSPLQLPMRELAARTGEEQFANRAKFLLQRAPMAVPAYYVIRQLLKEFTQ